MSHRPFEDRVAIVTGGGQGIGRACAERLLRDGARVVVADISTERGEPTVSALAALGEVEFVRLDISNEESCASCIADTLDRFGALHILINNAALAYDLDIDDQSTEYMKRVFDVNLFGSLFMTAAGAGVMAQARYGRVVNVSSDAALVRPRGSLLAPGAEDHFPGLIGPGWARATYGWAKAGVIHLTKMAAIVLGPWGVTVNAVAPGITRTESAKRHLPPGFDEVAARAAPLKRVCEPEDPAGVICFLASDDAGMVTGQVLEVNGGATIS